MLRYLIYSCFIPALEVMHKQGYVHRDVSRGNIILVKHKDGTYVGVLIDFEYAIKYTAGGKHVDRSVVRGISLLLYCCVILTLY